MRKETFLLVCCIIVSVICIQPAMGEQMYELGARAVGMGGTFVAIGDDMSSYYWNPGSTSKFGGLGLQVTAGNGLDFTGNMLDFLEPLTNVASFGDITQSTPTLSMLSDYAALIQSLDGLSTPGNGILNQTPSGVTLCMDRITIAANMFASIGITPSVDLENVGFSASARSALFSGADTPQRSAAGGHYSIAAATDTPDNAELLDDALVLAGVIDTLISEGFDLGSEFAGYTSTQIANALINGAGDEGLTATDIEEIVSSLDILEDLLASILGTGGGSIEDNQSSLAIKGLGIGEAILGFSGVIGADVSFGINLKYQTGFTYYTKILVSSGSPSVDVGELTTSSAFSTDAGILIDLKKTMGMRIGVVMKNMNSPKFDVAANADGIEYFELAPQTRVGISFYPIHLLGIALDYDLTENDTLVDGYKSQMASVGAEFNLVPPSGAALLNVAARVGAKCNLAMVDDVQQAIDNNELVYTAGVGISFATIGIDIAGSFNNATTTLNRDVLVSALGEDAVNTIESSMPIEGIPPGVQFAVSVSMRFGGPKKSKKADEYDYFYEDPFVYEDPFMYEDPYMYPEPEPFYY